MARLWRDSPCARTEFDLSDIELLEVSPRDGLQNEPRTLSTDDKLELVRRSIDAGVRRIEVASFVHPGKVPQMADAERWSPVGPKV